jgi:hypothetical protein
MSHEYIRFIEVLKGLSSKDGGAIDPEAKLLLDEIAIQHFKNTPLTVSDLMALKHIASPATIHRKLDSLLQANLVELKFEGDNRRTKFISITKTGDRYISNLSKAMIKAVKLA